MLKEQRNRQPNDELKRRWFSDDFFDLIVWEDEQGEIVQFELCYDVNRNEQSFCWSKDNGHDHHKVDDGEIFGRHKMSPIFVADGLFDSKPVKDKFLEASTSIDPKVAEFIHQKMLDYELNL